MRPQELQGFLPKPRLIAVAVEDHRRPIMAPRGVCPGSVAKLWERPGIRSLVGHISRVGTIALGRNRRSGVDRVGRRPSDHWIKKQLPRNVCQYGFPDRLPRSSQVACDSPIHRQRKLETAGTTCCRCLSQLLGTPRAAGRVPSESHPRRGRSTPRRVTVAANRLTVFALFRLTQVGPAPVFD